jgi:hypothetical protein
MTAKFKVKNGRLTLNDKQYVSMNFEERCLFETFINYKKQQFYELKALRNKIVFRKFIGLI